jgi:DNA modification methylase
MLELNPYYQEEGITIYNADCVGKLPCSDPGNTLLLTDPPYGIQHKSSYTAPSTTAKWMEKEIFGDSDTASRDYAIGKYKEWAVFGSIKQVVPHSWYRGVLVWDKGEASGMGDLSFPWKPSWELIFVGGEMWNGRRDSGVLSGFTVVTRASMGRTHPNEKPVSLIKHIISKHPAKVIVDPFMGTGATLIAAREMGRAAIGFEIEEEYCEIAKNRLAQRLLF